MSAHHQENVSPAQSPTLDSATVVKFIARSEALSLRPEESRDAMLRVGPLELDLIERTAKRGDRAIDLRPGEFRLLEYMMRRNDQMLTRAQLLKDLWSCKSVPPTNLVDVHMGRLRHKVDEPHEPPMILNFRGAGFILRAPGGFRPHNPVSLHARICA
jgi:two-component system OmpR family response regulator